jgi:4-alpha-glucanotransferase
VQRPELPLERSSGVLLHPTSLPGGRFGPEAERFVDWLAAAGQSWWQVLPLVPPDEHGSPYKSASAFAGWPGFLAHPGAEVSPAELDAFRDRHGYWIEGWERFAGPEAAADQVRFQREWDALRAYAAARGVRVIGDLPIYVSAESADVAEHPELFDAGGVAGAPPDYFNPDGQLWGTPVYDGRAVRADGDRWWTERFRRTFELVDVARIDHFRGFVAYWAVPPADERAARGRGRRGPGRALFVAVERELGRIPVIAEDLGVITPAVYRLRDWLGVPGMRVLRFGFDGDPANVHALANHDEYSVVYTGTHDHDPVASWWASASETERRRAAEQMAAAGLDDREPAWGLIRLALSAPARLAVIQAQDALELGSEARLNTPGTSSGNWAWRLEPGQLTDELAARLLAATRDAGRLIDR